MVNAIPRIILPVKLYAVTALVLALSSGYHYFIFNRKSFDTYYVWSSAYYIGTSVLLSLLFVLYFIVYKVQSKSMQNRTTGFSLAHYIISVGGMAFLSVLIHKITRSNTGMLDYSVYRELNLYIDNAPIYNLINYGCLIVLIIQIVLIGAMVVFYWKGK